MRFANTEYFRYAWWLIAGVAILWFYYQWRRRKISAIANDSFLNLILPGHKNRNYLASGIFLLTALAFIILALANLTWSSEPVKGKAKAMDIVFALDVSKSMDAQDVKPSRLERAIQFISETSMKLPGYKLGLVVFAGNAYVQMPLTTDANALKLFLANTSTNIIAEQGTAITDAIETSKGLLFPDGRPKPGTPESSKVILLLTDGEDHEGEAVEAAREEGKDGVIIDAIGIGTGAGAPIPVYNNGFLERYIKNNEGETVISKMDERNLKEITSEAHGKFYDLGGNPGISDQLVKDLNALASGEQQIAIFDIRETRYQWFAGAALFLLLFEIAFRNGYIKRLRKNEI